MLKLCSEEDNEAQVMHLNFKVSNINLFLMKKLFGLSPYVLSSMKLIKIIPLLVNICERKYIDGKA